MIYARIANVRDRDEDLERILLIRLPDAPLHLPLNLRLAFLAVATINELEEGASTQFLTTTYVVNPRSFL